jgi:hypothetical protein
MAGDETLDACLETQHPLPSSANGDLAQEAGERDRCGEIVTYAQFRNAFSHQTWNELSSLGLVRLRAAVTLSRSCA